MLYNLQIYISLATTYNYILLLISHWVQPINSTKTYKIKYKFITEIKKNVKKYRAKVSKFIIIKIILNKIQKNIIKCCTNIKLWHSLT